MTRQPYPASLTYLPERPFPASSGTYFPPKSSGWKLDSIGPRVLYMCVNCGFGCCEAGNGHGFRFQRSGIEVDEGVVHGQPTHYFVGLLKAIPICVLHRKRPFECA